MWLKFFNIRIKALFIVLLLGLQSACVGPILTGAEMYYERFELTKTLNDAAMVSKGNKILQRHRIQLKNSRVVLAAFNRDLVILGQVPDEGTKEYVVELMRPIVQRRRLFNELKMAPPIDSVQRLKDSWITMSIRSKMLLNSKINQKEFKVVTEGGEVYILGDVRTEQAKVVVQIAKNTSGVRKVVRVFKYYQYVKAQDL